MIFCSLSVIKPWNRLPSEVVESPSLRVLKPDLTWHLAICSKWPCFEQQSGLDTSIEPFQPQLFCLCDPIFLIHPAPPSKKNPKSQKINLTLFPCSFIPPPPPEFSPQPNGRHTEKHGVPVKRKRKEPPLTWLQKPSPPPSLLWLLPPSKHQEEAQAGTCQKLGRLMNSFFYLFLLLSFWTCFSQEMVNLMFATGNILL